MDIVQTGLAHITSVLPFVCLAVYFATKRDLSTQVKLSLALITFGVLLAPALTYSVSHYLRPLTGDLSMTSLIWFTVLLYSCVVSKPLPNDHSWLALIVLVTAIVFYPTALGLTYFDLYAYGYYPVVLAPCLFVVFALAILNRWYLIATVTALAYIGFLLDLLESDNLWDYLLDPITLVYAIVTLIRHPLKLERFQIGQVEIERFVVVTITTFLAFSVLLSRSDHHAFRYDFTIEDGFVEWCTVIVLFITMCVCAKRFWTLRGKRNALFLGVTGLLTVFCLFGAGEEISWGQRIFGIETPAFLKERNAQGELGLHNLVIEVDGERVKINKLIFGTGLAIALSIYLFIATPLYRRNIRVRNFFNAIAAPMPRNFHIIGYLAIVATVELLIDSSKRGEMTEFAGSMMFAMNVIFPYNPEIFDPEHDIQQAPNR